MNLQLLPVVALFFATSLACAQPTELCQGHYYTEQQGADKLAALQRRIVSKQEWEARADSLRQHVRQGMELDVLPERKPLNPQFRNKKILDGYSVESVVFESLPGFYVTGNLYMPTGRHKKKSLAAVLMPHGHFPKDDDYGRFMRDVQYAAATIAKMGALVFAYDMVGWGESVQLPHKHEKVLAFQTWNSMRALDFLLTYPEADPNRTAVTGASGGGTQTFMLAALDKRITLAIPVVMVSAHFFGGCSCESGMPVHRNGNTVYTNAEIAASIAPRPLLLVSDGKDWTKNSETVEYPFTRHIYNLYGKEANVELAHFPDEGHDYGKNKRLSAYKFLARHLALDTNNVQDEHGQISENFVAIQKQKDLTFFTPDELNKLVKGDAIYRVFVDAKRIDGSK